jgi:hypothetical protein
MGRRYRKQTGGLDYLQDAALVGLGAYAARNPNTMGSSIILNTAKYILYFFATVFVLIFLTIVLVLVFAPKGEKKATAGTSTASTPTS